MPRQRDTKSLNQWDLLYVQTEFYGFRSNDCVSGQFKLSQRNKNYSSQPQETTHFQVIQEKQQSFMLIQKNRLSCYPRKTANFPVGLRNQNFLKSQNIMQVSPRRQQIFKITRETTNFQVIPKKRRSLKTPQRNKKISSKPRVTTNFRVSVKKLQTLNLTRRTSTFSNYLGAINSSVSPGKNKLAIYSRKKETFLLVQGNNTLSNWNREKQRLS